MCCSVGGGFLLLGVRVLVVETRIYDGVTGGAPIGRIAFDRVKEGFRFILSTCDRVRDGSLLVGRRVLFCKNSYD